MHSVLYAALKRHSPLDASDLRALKSLDFERRKLRDKQDVVRQGEKPQTAIVVLDGMFTKYVTLRDGRIQYLSLHIVGDLLGVQSVFFPEMDYGISAIGENAVIAEISHQEMRAAMKARPEIGYAIWRQTLVHASIFRQAIVNNSAREPTVRMAHFFAEQYYRAHSGENLRSGECYFPLTQSQLGEALGISVVTTNRAFQEVRNNGGVDWRPRQLVVHDWAKLVELGQFDPAYLHLARPAG